MISRIQILVLFCLVADAALGSANAEAGKNLYGTCVACHGDQGQGNRTLNSPAIAGQNAAYLIRQLEQFQSGVRGSDPADTLGAQMRGMAATLSGKTAIVDVVAYIETLAGEGSGTGTTSGTTSGTMPAPGFDARNGEVQYNAACGACHGGRAEGNPNLNAPRLSGLDPDYLLRQYENYASGIRGSSPDDQYGRQMQMMTSMLATEKDLQDVIGFISTQ